MNQHKRFNYASLASLLGILGNVSGKELRAPCPLHQDTNPSWSMNIDTGLWKCFSRCGAGNFQRLVEERLSYSSQEARRWIESNGQENSLEVLMSQVGGQLAPPLAPSYTAPEVGWLEEYQFYNRNLMPQWLFDRGFTWETVNHWQMVYNQGADSLIIPIFWEGEMVGTVTRNTNPALPRYKNSDNLPVERIFFGEISRDRRDIILVEGVLDAIWLWQLGYHAVCLLGANLTRFQVSVLLQYRFGEITLALDNDEAGRIGTTNATTTLVAAGFLVPQINLIRFPGNRKEDPGYRKDPNECSSAEFGLLYENRKGIWAA